MKRKFALIIGTAALALTACTSIGADRLGVEYSYGPQDGVHYNEVVTGADGDIFVGNDDMYQVPAGLRTYTLDADDERADVRADISVPSSDQVTVVDFKVTVSFALNTRTDDITGPDGKIVDGGTLRQFMEKVCLGDRCIDPDNPDNMDGWRTMLDKRMKPALVSSFRDTARLYPTGMLVYNLPFESTDKSGNKVARPVQELVKEQAGDQFRKTLVTLLGGNFFCGPTFDRNNKNPQQACPPIELTLTRVEYNNPDVQKSREAQAVAENNAKAKQVEGQSLVDFQNKVAAALKDPAYVQYLQSQNELKAAEACATSAKSCVLIIGNGGANVNVPVPN